MLRAIVEDLSEFAETVVIMEDRFESPSSQSNVVAFDASLPLWSQWAKAAKGCDAALIIAPESDGTLAKGVATLRAAGINVIAGSGDFLRVASDKLLAAQLWHNSGVPHPEFFAITDHRMIDEMRSCDRFVVKPRDGCGTQAIQIVDGFDNGLELMNDNSLMQKWVPGRNVSISLISSGAHQVFLPAVSQDITGGQCHYTGGSGPLGDDYQRRAHTIASRAVAAMPPTARGFVGVDLILGDRPGEDYVIEINPRLTTSYVGLRQMIHGNLAARLFDIETGPARCKASVESVHWTNDGVVTIDTAESVG